MSGTRVFFVLDGREASEEIFETREEAVAYNTKHKIFKPRLRICIVKNAYKEEDGRWNYDDQADTFTTIKTLIRTE